MLELILGFIRIRSILVYREAVCGTPQNKLVSMKLSVPLCRNVWYFTKLLCSPNYNVCVYTENDTKLVFFQGHILLLHVLFQKILFLPRRKSSKIVSRYFWIIYPLLSKYWGFFFLLLDSNFFTSWLILALQYFYGLFNTYLILNYFYYYLLLEKY